MVTFINMLREWNKRTDLCAEKCNVWICKCLNHILTQKESKHTHHYIVILLPEYFTKCNECTLSWNIGNIYSHVSYYYLLCWQFGCTSAGTIRFLIQLHNINPMWTGGLFQNSEVKPEFWCLTVDKPSIRYDLWHQINNSSVPRQR